MVRKSDLSTNVFHINEEEDWAFFSKHSNALRVKGPFFFSLSLSTILKGPRKRKRDAPLPFYGTASVTSLVSPLSCSHYQ